MNSPESLLETPDRKDMPRKRSKVSRACDACRRKKIRCDAEYLSTLLKVTKVCNNCSKNADECTFSRVPMKRGPSKGYIRDLVDHMDNAYGSQYPSGHHTSVIKLDRPRSNLEDVAAGNTASNTTSSAPPVISVSSHKVGTPGGALLGQGLMKPMLHRLAFTSLPGTTLPIILPPLLGPLPLTQPVKVSIPVTNGGAPVSPHAAALAQSTRSPEGTDHRPDNRIQGPLWKVPYEMPSLQSAGLAASSPGTGIGNGLSVNSRRSSVDSVSLILTTGSRSRLPSLKPLMSANTEPFVSDLDDDYYSVRSRAYSASLSPRNSVSSMLSLNGRMNTQLVLNGPPAPPPAAVSPAPYHFSPQVMVFNSQQPRNHPLGPPIAPIPLNSIEHNLRVYYSKFHANFPILPSNELQMLRLLSALQAEQGPTLQIVHLFNSALNNLVHYQLVPLEMLIDLLRHFLSLYPFNHHGLASKDDLLLLLFLALVIVNYTILINGDVYSLGISLASSVFNDFKVLEHYAEFCNSRLQNTDPDDVQLLLPRLYFCLSIIDSCHSLSFGCLPQMAGTFDMLYKSVDKLFPAGISSASFRYNIQAARMLNDLVKLRSLGIFSSSMILKYNPNWGVNSESSPSNSPIQNFAALFINQIKDKYELYDYLIENYNHLKGIPHKDVSEDDIYENFYDYQFKSSRLIKKLSQSILNFANYVSTIYSQMRSASSPVNYDLINPFFNMSYGQSFKLIKACKLLIDSLLEHVSNNEIVTRAVKINNDLSIAFNLLMSNLNNNMPNGRNGLPNQGKANGASTAQFSETLDACGLGATCVNLIMNKLELYKLNFGSLPSPDDATNGKRRNNLELWKQEFMNTITSFVSREDIDGWY
ncbi:CIC11C00000003598 [Sungouiella intermedia]|uniref:CIC11C00000003598 n=1 Tax=Sungouiella intermedia TaxID=45354 RepID=A0A1L0BV11_9ASCO|nr:CIC11C00000003598 [[Candida] intermedia]